MTLRVLDSDGPGRLLKQPGIRRVLSAMAADGEETRLVGGCVRDALLGREVSDVDLATTLLPAATTARAAAAGLKTVPTGFDHGTVTVIVDGQPFEVTTLREDIETDGRHAVVRFSRDFARDAERRDFTINALSLGADGALHDPTGGVADLVAGRVRFIGQPSARIREDALRILRFFRFHARYGVDPPDADGLSACIGARAALDGLSRERVRAEFLKLLAAPGAVAAIGVLSETGLLMRLIGGVGEIGRLQRAAHDASLQLTSQAINRGSPPPGGEGQGEGRALSGERTPLTPVLSPWEREPVAGTDVARLAALAVRVVEDADRLRASLRLSKAEHGALAAYAVALAVMRGRAAIDGGVMRALVVVHGIEAVAGVTAAVATEPRPVIAEDARAVLEGFRSGAVPVPVLPLTGADLVARGVAPGPEIGARLAAARRLWLSQGCPDDAGTADALMVRALSTDPTNE